jgi:muramoyltetrapeptide carboxypeptidase
VSTAYLALPAYPVPTERRAACLDRAQQLAAAAGCVLVATPLIDHPAHTWISPADRRADLRRAQDHALVIAGRGGHGCIDLVDLAGDLPPLIGYSDLTILHAARWRRGHRDGVHGAMPGVALGERAWTTTATLIAGGAIALTGTDTLRAGVATGPLFPACLRILASLVGTPWMPALSGCVLALEDIDEKPHAMDRDLHQLDQAGCLGGLAGLVFGRFPCAQTWTGPDHRAIAAAWAARLARPTAYAAPIGHDADPHALPVGRSATLAATPTGWSLIA